MRLFLPTPTWHITLKKPLYEYTDMIDDLGIGEADLGLVDEPENEAYIKETYDIAQVLGRPEFKKVEKCWYWCTEDPVSLPGDSMGTEIEVCMGRSVVYQDYDKAIVDLARVYPPVARLLYLLVAGPQTARPLARAVLDGDRAALTVLADALEEAGHSEVKEIRKLAKAEPKKAPPQGGRGKPLPSAPAAAAPKAAPKIAPQPAIKSGANSTSAQQEIVLVGGYPAAGKSSYVQALVQAGYERLNRDDAGGTLEQLHKRAAELVRQGRSVVLDNLYATAESRRSALKTIGGDGVPARFVWLGTSMEDALVNACLRMAGKYGRVLHPEDHKLAPYKSDPSVYPVAVMYKYRNDFEEPTKAEGFADVQRVPFVRQYPAEWTNRAAIFDFDGTLRTHSGKEKFPIKPGEVQAMRARAPKLRKLREEGYLLLGASNQSGVAKGKLTKADAEACFAETIRQLGVPFEEVLFCPHKVPPLTCYCRKPNPGMGVELIVKHKLDPKQCIYVGDMGTDRTFAEKCGFQFFDQADFFGS